MPREGHDLGYNGVAGSGNPFQSTCPARGTTRNVKTVDNGIINFNPRAPRGARPRVAVYLYAWQYYFNPRAPRGARRKCRGCRLDYARISIHVPREGHDMIPSCCKPDARYFNPRAPRGARRDVGRRTRRGRAISIHVPREGHDRLLWRTWP